MNCIINTAFKNVKTALTLALHLQQQLPPLSLTFLFAPAHGCPKKKAPHTLFAVRLLVWIPNHPKKACAICCLSLHFQNIDASK